MARISELHYSNAYAKQSGVKEFVEVALKPGDDPADFSIGLYGTDGTQVLEIRLDDPAVRVTFDADANEYVYVASSDDFPFLLTDPDGSGTNASAVALADTSSGGGTVDFYDIGGGTTGIVATDGVAAGSTSQNVPTPTAPNKADYTLQWNADSPDTVTYASVDPGETGAICFVPGARILTLSGWRAVEALRVGDRVLTRDNGAQPIAWIGRRTVCGLGKLAPFEVPRGLLRASRPLLISPQHRLLLTGPQVHLLTGEAEAFCPVVRLADGHGIRRRPVPRVTYLHLMFERHEVIWADGVATESFFVGPGSMAAMTPAMREEFEALFPGLAGGTARAAGPGALARLELHRAEATLLRFV